MTLHDLCEAARNTACACGAPPGCPCVAPPRHYHLRRFSRARASELIGLEDVAYLIRNFPRDVIDPGEEDTP